MKKYITHEDKQYNTGTTLSLDIVMFSGILMCHLGSFLFIYIMAFTKVS